MTLIRKSLAEIAANPRLFTEAERARLLAMTEEEIEAGALADADNLLRTDDEVVEARREQETQLTALNEQFVYIYRNKDGSPMYVGRGRKALRSQSHAGDHAHNKDLTEAIKANPEYSVEIAGPFDHASTSAMVEAAVISALKRTPALDGFLKNKVDGQSSGNFRTLGVPNKFAARPSLPLLTKDELRHLTDGRPVLFVLLGDKVLADGRLGIDLANPLGVEETQKRMIEWWQLKKHMDQWRDQPSVIPGILIGVAGTLKQRIVVGSLQIDVKPAALPWPPKKPDSAARRVPVVPHPELDYGELRGRRVDPAIVRFGQGRSEHYRIV